MSIFRSHTLRALIGLSAIGLVALLGTGCSSKKVEKGEQPDIGDTHKSERPADVKVPKVTFTDVTKKAGIDFTHTSGAFGKKLLPETMGSGVAFLDYDGDGHQDILFVNSCPWPGQPEKKDATLKLYRNKGDGNFEDVTEKAGLKVQLYGMGVTCGDFDNDGWTDVFIAGVGGNRLFRNNKGKFEDVTEPMKVGGPGGWAAAVKAPDFLKHDQPLTFSCSATFLDYDGDGKLDLFVCNYVGWSPNYDLSQSFTLTGKERAYGPPRSFEGAVCFLYRNRDDHFEDISAQAGVQVQDTEGVGLDARKRGAGKSLGVVVCDPDGDGWPDIVIANDTVRNFFFRNVPDGKGGRKFEEEGTLSGIAYATSQAQARGAMGIDWGEYRPGLHALIIANFSNEPNTFLRLDRPRTRLFQDVAVVEGLAGSSRPPLKFGAFFFDYDLDGRLDLLTCNGHLEPDIAKVQPGQTYAQPAQLFWNTGADKKSRFTVVTAEDAGPDLFRPIVGRGCAYADINGDGYPDIVLVSNGGPAMLLKNEGGTGNHWIRLVLKGDGKRSNRSAIGARVEVKVGDNVYRREIVGARGYMSQSELAITVGLGKATKVDSVTIHWPGKDFARPAEDQEPAEKPQVVKDLPADKVHVIEQK